jgi:MFS family permease
MAVGAVAVSPLADKMGRRRHILLCLAAITAGMAVSAVARNVPEMIAYRAISGLFIGALVPSLNITVSEYCSDRRHGVVMGIYGIGLPAGAGLGGLASSILLARYGWQAAFIFGAVLSGITFLIALWALPESIEYLVERQPKNALQQFNAIAARLGQPPVSVLPEPVIRRGESASWRLIFTGMLGRRTALLWLVGALLASAFYFANTWTPKLIADATGNPAMGVKVGVLMLLGGVFGALCFAAFSLWMRPRLATVVITICGAVAFVAYARYFANSDWAFGLAFLVGLFAAGAIAASIAIGPPIYPAAVRGTAIGWAIGFGRGVSILTPIATGYLLAGGIKPPTLYYMYAVILLLAAAACYALDQTYATDDGAIPAT